MTDINVLQYDLPPSGSLGLPMVHTLCPLSVSSLPPLFPSISLCIMDLSSEPDFCIMCSKLDNFRLVLCRKSGTIYSMTFCLFISLANNYIIKSFAQHLSSKVLICSL